MLQETPTICGLSLPFSYQPITVLTYVNILDEFNTLNNMVQGNCEYQARYSWGGFTTAGQKWRAFCYGRCFLHTVAAIDLPQSHKVDGKIIESTKASQKEAKSAVAHKAITELICSASTE
jgi:hypothetical protein